MLDDIYYNQTGCLNLKHRICENLKSLTDVYIIFIYFTGSKNVILPLILSWNKTFKLKHYVTF